MLGWFKRGSGHTRSDTLEATQRGQALCEEGRAAQLKGDLLAAQLAFEGALKLDPENADCHYLLGGLFAERQEFPRAALHYQRAFTLRPQFEHACQEAARIFMLLGQFEEAQVFVAAGLALNPANADFLFFDGNLNFLYGELDAALASYRAALALGANYSKLHSYMGAILLQRNDSGTSLLHLQRAIEIDPGNTEALLDLGVIHTRLGNVKQAIACYEMAIAADPEHLQAHSCLLFALAYSVDCTPNHYQSVATAYAAHARRAARKLPPPGPTAGATSAPKKLRVGWVSGDFRQHVNMAFLTHVLTALSQQPLELVAFSNNPFNDNVTHDLRSLMTQWHDIGELGDQEAARLIQACQVDILIDLSGHTGHNRLPIFAWRAAPIQVSWLGYFASTGLTEVDYLIADPFSVPAEWQSHFSEKVYYLPDTRLCMTPPPLADSITVKPLPALSTGFVTFASFQALAKINDDVLAAWQQILSGVAGSRLRLQIRYLDVQGVREALTRRIERAGIAMDCVTLVNGTSPFDYLNAHNEVDVILDTFPFPGGTTTAEALWMGVPTVTLKGDTLLGRQGASMLMNAGLPQWVAEDRSDYVKRAIALANDTSALARLRLELRQQVQTTALFDRQRFAAQFLSALQSMQQAQNAP